MEILNLHSWKMAPKEAAALQERLAERVRAVPIRKTIRRIAGLDCAFSKDHRRIGAVIVVLSFPDLEIAETVQAADEVRFPYVPGLLSFREAPVCLKAAEKLKCRPDVFLVDGQGYAHPRRLGLASHLGLFLDRPTIGCAKSRLIGTYKEPAPQKSSMTPLYDETEIIGAVLRTRTNVKPLFVSVGHLCTVDEAIEITLQCTTRYRLPEPTRLAHQKVTALKAKL
jgi:deoxyribonuclease V